MTTLTAQVVRFVLQLAGTMVLARLLIPSDYGVIGMVMVVVSFAVMFKDAGLTMATVQRETISHEQISTLFWLNVLISILLTLGVLIGSPVVAWFYGKPELTAITAALSLSFLVSGLSIQHQALLRRHMQFGTLAVIQIASYFANLVVTILLALAGWRYWALVGGTLTTALSGTLLTWMFCPWLPGRMHRGTGVRDMLKFGGHLTGFNFVGYFSRNTDNILIGRFLGADALGLYAKAYQLFMLPIGQIAVPMTQVAVPVLSTLRNQPERYTKYYQRLLDIMASLVMPVTVYCAIEANFLIRVLLGPTWVGAVSVFRILAVAGFIQAIAGTRGLVLLSCGLSRRYFYWGLFNAILCVASFIVGLPFGIEGVAVSYTIANYVILLPSLFFCFFHTPVTVALFMKTLVPSFVISGAAAAGLAYVKWTYSTDTVMAHALYAGVFVVVYGGLAYRRQSIRETLSLILKQFAYKKERMHQLAS
ncbi:MAG: lipopolysaccharide biosynthesis protein [Sedimentisphaerales bacterium]|nr:lipopolysaccharide biosynthesis protein [Sedimentisphaerales bacterium]